MRNTLSDVVYEKVYRDIVSGKLKPGTKITEMGLANSTGTSRSPVREALKRLAEDRLVTLVARSRCYVRKLTIEEVSVLFEIRKRLECLALECAFEHIDKKKLLVFKQEFESYLQKLEEVTSDEALDIDARFHDFIRVSSGSEDLIQMLNNLNARVNMFKIQEFKAMVPLPMELCLSSHVWIIDAILADDLEKALELMDSHIDTGQNHMLNFLYEKEDAAKTQEVE